MTSNPLKVYTSANLHGARMVMGFSGWMDGGEVSTGTIETLVNKLGAEVLAEIDSQDFYIFSFPGSMELSALFRPHVKIADGLITAFQEPTNTFYSSEGEKLILFAGKEPNLAWERYADCVFSVVRRFGVSAIYFIGSVAGLVPHTREPRMFASVSDAGLKAQLEPLRVRFSNYEGPGSFVTYLTRRAAEEKVPMISFVGEIPAYVQGRNPTCIEAATRHLAGFLGVQVSLDDLKALGSELRKRLDEVVHKHPELVERIRGLEEDYDNDVFDTEMGDLKSWLQEKGIRLD